MSRTQPLLTAALGSLLLSACAVDTVAFEAPAASSTTASAALAEHLATPGPIRHEAVLSARWAVPLKGLVDLSDPRAAELEDAKHPIVLPVHVLEHPDAGVYVVDTGVPRAPHTARGAMKIFIKDVQPVETLGAILDRQSAPLGGVLLTHSHLDHVLGLPDVPEGVPVHVGAGDERPANLSARLMQPTLRRALDGRSLSTWDFEGPEAFDLLGVAALDLLGDGSLYALDAHGHTPGSTAYLARTTGGPVLFTGDCSHTRWGWEHGVTPGSYTHDHAANAKSLDALRRLAQAVPGMRVEVGHELTEEP